MTVIHIPAFSGLNILAAPQRIGADQATVAIGCDFRSLDLRPFKGDKASGIGSTDAGAIASVIAYGASIFQWDASTWIGVRGDKNFARSPTFYADGTTGQRIFVADNAAPYPSNSPDIAWNWVQEVEKSNLRQDTTLGPNSITYFLDGTTVRLGVPKPGDIASFTYDQKRGRITTITRSTVADAIIEVKSGEEVYLQSGDKIVLDVPAIGDGPFTITGGVTGESRKFTVRGGRLSYLQINAKKTNNSTDVTFKKTDHGLNDDDLVVLCNTADSAANNAGYLGKLPTVTYNGLSYGYKAIVFRVRVVDTNTFKLHYAQADTELALTSTVTVTNGDDLVPMKVARIATFDDAIPNYWNMGQVLVNTPSTYQQSFTYLNIPDDITAIWEIASETLVERSYVVTWVNKYGDESEPSNPTKTFPVAQGDPVTFKGLPLTAAAYPEGFGDVSVADYGEIREIRLYRTDALGTYRLVTTGIANATGDVNGTVRKILWADGAEDFVDTYPDTELGEPLSTQGWQIPPRDLNGIVVSPGGSLVGYRDRGVFGSVPYAPYAFPIGNRVAFDHNVRGLVATSAGLVVVTDGMPALIVGDDPASWSIQKLEYPYGCVSRRSIVDMGELAIYASAEGLVGVAGASVEILTKDMITRAQWQDLYNPSQIFAAHAEGRYYGVTTMPNGTTKKAFMFDPRTRTFIDLAVDPLNYPIAMYSRLEDNTLLILKSSGLVYEWNRGSEDVRYTWVSKAFQLTRPEIMGCCQIIATSLVANKDFIFRLYGWDGEGIVLIATFSSETVTNDPANRQYRFDKNVNPFRLPLPVDRYTVFQVALEGTLSVGQVTLASVMDELKQA